MPNRIIKESICKSSHIDSLSWFEEVLYYRLIVNCDDYGRFDGRIPIIKNLLFPLKDSLTLRNVSAAINKLASVGLVTLYECDGKPFLLLPTWNEHQQIRSKKSKYPAPELGDSIENHVKSNDIKCNQMQSNVTVIQSNPNPIQSETESESESNVHAHMREGVLDRFARFWNAYPKKVGKSVAEKSFKKIKPDESLLQKMLYAIEQQRKTNQWMRDGGRYIPNPSTWLNQRRWEDEGIEPSVMEAQTGDPVLTALREMYEEAGNEDPPTNAGGYRQ
mgnify:CR=1 FL=1